MLHSTKNKVQAAVILAAALVAVNFAHSKPPLAHGSMPVDAESGSLSMRGSGSLPAAIMDRLDERLDDRVAQIGNDEVRARVATVFDKAMSERSGNNDNSDTHNKDGQKDDQPSFDDHAGSKNDENMNDTSSNSNQDHGNQDKQDKNSGRKHHKNHNSGNDTMSDENAGSSDSEAQSNNSDNSEISNTNDNSEQNTEASSTSEESNQADESDESEATSTESESELPSDNSDNNESSSTAATSSEQTSESDESEASSTIASGSGMVSINFDDGWQSAYDIGAPILESAGFKGTFFVISGVLGEGNYMTWNEVKDLENAGNEIGDHTRDHPDFSTVSDSTAKTEIGEGFDDLESHGITPQSFAYPYGHYDSADEKSVEDEGLTNARAAGSAFKLNDEDTDPYAIWGQSLTNDMTFDEIKDNIDEAVSQGKWYVITVHSIDTPNQDPYNISSDLLQQIVDYLKKNDIKVVTNSEAVGTLGLD